MISFESDYIAGAHPRILERLAETNMEAVSGYGMDSYCTRAKEKICAACDCKDAQVEFLVGGTQTNALVIASLLQAYEGVIAAETGHVSTHEAGAIEAGGHKVLTVPQKEGKIEPASLKAYLETFYADENHEHMVFPGMVYVSHPTEYGTLYTKKELRELADICHTYEIPLYLDGARLGYGLMSTASDMTFADIARICDVFYIGGTKVGALCGEAVVFTKKNMPKHFRTFVKQRGALLAKGRLLGIQFDTLFTDELYLQIASHAIQMAEQLKALLHENGIPFFLESPTNQQFVIFENKQLEQLQKQIGVSFWEAYDENHTVVRLATSWSTTQNDIDELRKALTELA